MAIGCGLQSVLSSIFIGSIVSLCLIVKSDSGCSTPLLCDPPTHGRAAHLPFHHHHHHLLSSPHPQLHCPQWSHHLLSSPQRVPSSLPECDWLPPPPSASAEAAQTCSRA